MILALLSSSENSWFLQGPGKVEYHLLSTHYDLRKPCINIRSLVFRLKDLTLKQGQKLMNAKIQQNPRGFWRKPWISAKYPRI